MPEEIVMQDQTVMRAKIVLRAKGVIKRFGQVTALDGTDFELRSGEILAVIGDNGAGKSSLIKVLSGASMPDAGEIFLDERAIHRERGDLVVAVLVEVECHDLRDLARAEDDEFTFHRSHHSVLETGAGRCGSRQAKVVNS